MFRNPWVPVSTPRRWMQRARQALRELADRGAPRASGARMAAVSTSTPAEVPVARPVRLVFALDDNLERINRAPAATAARWAFAVTAEGARVDGATIEAFAAGERLHPGVTLLGGHGGLQMIWECPSGAVARIQARKLATVPGFTKMQFTAHSDGREVKGEIGSTSFWIALRAFDTHAA